MEIYRERLEELVEFLQKSQNGKSAAPDEKTRGAYAGKVPNAMFEIWERVGCGVFLDGYFQLCSPSRYVSVIETVLDGDSDLRPAETHVIGFSAFGELYAWNELHRIVNIDLVDGRVTCVRLLEPKPELDPNMSLIASLLTSDGPASDVKDGKGKGMFSRALSRLGVLPFGSIYGFRPILALGGPRNPDRLSVYEALAHMTILSQSTEFKLMDSASITPKVVRVVGNGI